MTQIVRCVLFLFLTIYLILSVIAIVVGIAHGDSYIGYERTNCNLREDYKSTLRKAFPAYDFGCYLIKPQYMIFEDEK